MITLNSRALQIGNFYRDALLRSQTTGERYGQALFNLLHERHPELAEQVRNTYSDPFYVPEDEIDSPVWARFSDFIYQNWP